MKLLITCEHGGNKIPKQYASFFKDAKSILKTHRGFDLGALDVFNNLQPLSDYSKYSETSRLLIELNRSLNNKQLFSKMSETIPLKRKESLINGYYLKYRNTVKSKIESFIKTNETVVHISVHSFTPILNNEERLCDIGLLFDPAVKGERLYCKNLKEQILKFNPHLKVRFNYPYLGKADGFTTYLRKHFPEKYIGIEIEINQKYSKNNIMDEGIKAGLHQAIQSINIISNT